MFENINLTDPITIITICCLILIFYYYIIPSVSSKELFNKNEDDMDQIYGMVNGIADSPVKLISTKDFDQMTTEIKKIIYVDIINYANTCSSMNGSDGPEPNQMTLQCISDTMSIKEDITNHIAEYIIDHISDKFNINLNPYQVVGDFMVNLDLINDVINPLLFSGLYTVHGIQYFDKNMLSKIISSNQDIQNVLYTTLQRRGIDVNQLNNN
jgi:hypothetical protein